MNKSWIGITLVACFLQGCGSGSAPEPNVATNMVVSSSSFASGQAIPEKYSAYGENISPALSWSGAPPGTKSFVLLLEDPDAPSKTPFVHWLVYNIPVGTTSIGEGQSPAGGVVGKNSANMVAYYGPKPPSGMHHYHFIVYALDAVLALESGAEKDAVVKAMAGHALGRGELVGTYSH